MNQDDMTAIIIRAQAGAIQHFAQDNEEQGERLLMRAEQLMLEFAQLFLPEYRWPKPPAKA